MRTMRKAIADTLGKNVFGAANVQEAAVMGGLDFKVGLLPLYTPSGKPIPNNFGIYRLREDGEGISPDDFFGAVKQKYTELQNEDVLQFGQDILEAAGEEGGRKAYIETIGQTGGGKRCFALYNLDKTFETVPGDKYNSYLGQTWSHDGNGAQRTFVIIRRGACENTIPGRMRRGDATDGAFIMRHTKSVLERTKSARTILSEAVRSVDDVQAKLRALAGRDCPSKFRERITDLLFPKPPENATEASKTRSENRRSLFLELFEENDGPTGFALIKDTALNAYNAYTEMIDHEIKVVRTTAKGEATYEEIRAERALFGNGSDQKAWALEEILEATMHAPARRNQSKIFVPSANLLNEILENTHVGV